jgi:circadian clock protein KaiC
MAHSNQIREFRLTSRGVQLTDVYLGAGGVLTGAGRAAQEASEQAQAIARQQDLDRKQRKLRRKRQELEAQILALRAAFEDDEEDLNRTIAQEHKREQSLLEQRTRMAGIRHADGLPPMIRTRRRPRLDKRRT